MCVWAWGGSSGSEPSSNCSSLPGRSLRHITPPMGKPRGRRVEMVEPGNQLLRLPREKRCTLVSLVIKDTGAGCAYPLAGQGRALGILQGLGGYALKCCLPSFGCVWRPRGCLLTAVSSPHILIIQAGIIFVLLLFSMYLFSLSATLGHKFCLCSTVS